MNESDVRERFHGALGETELPPYVTYQARAALRELDATPRAGRRWLAGAVAAALALVIIGGLVVAGGLLRNNSAPGHGGLQTPCTSLISEGGAWRGSPDNSVFLFRNSTDSPCSVTAPMITFVDGSGKTLAVPQDWAAGAQDQVLVVGARQGFAIPFSFDSLSCSASVRAEHLAATFSSGASVKIDEFVEFCPGSHITVSAAIPAQSCPDGSWVWTPQGQPRQTCPA